MACLAAGIILVTVVAVHLISGLFDVSSKLLLLGIGWPSLV